MQFSGLGQSRGSTGRSLHGPVRGAGAPSVGAANLVGEKRAFLQWLSELEAPPNQAIDVEAILLHGKEALRSLLRLLESGRMSA